LISTDLNSCGNGTCIGLNECECCTGFKGDECEIEIPRNDTGNGTCPPVEPPPVCDPECGPNEDCHGDEINDENESHAHHSHGNGVGHDGHDDGSGNPHHIPQHDSNINHGHFHGPHCVCKKNFKRKNGVCVLHCPGNCKKNVECLPNGPNNEPICQCASGYIPNGGSGSQLQCKPEIFCFGLPDEDSNVCNGQGFCQNQDKCKCFSGFKGTQCQNIDRGKCAWPTQLPGTPPNCDGFITCQTGSHTVGALTQGVCGNYRPDCITCGETRGSCVSQNKCKCFDEFIWSVYHNTCVKVLIHTT